MSIKQTPNFRLVRCCRLARQKRLCRSNILTRCASTEARKWSTPLAKSLAEAITTTGPISIAKYMRQCLTSPDGGYYTTRQAERGKDQFGKSGDFITSPEISQVFGELIGIWFLAQWMSQGKASSGVELVELGPGRGTLMDDILRTISTFKPMAQAIETIYLVEASSMLRELQKQLLCGDAPMDTHPLGFQCQSQRLPNTKIVWIEDIKFMPQEPTKTPFVVAHEFFDALPIHAFQSIRPTPTDTSSTFNQGMTRSTTERPSNTNKPPQNEWRELLVSPTAPPSIINPPSTPQPEFELTLSRTKTHHSDFLPKLSNRYTSLLHRTGSTIEISPESLTTMQDIVTLLSSTRASSTAATSPKQPTQRKPRPSGAALIIDYGPSDTIPISTLRGITQHTRVSPFATPGETDISADVDFGALVEAALAAAEDVEVHGPVEQGDWLSAMGGRERCDMLLKSQEADAELRDRIESGWRRLVERGPNGMGRLYKVMAVVPISEGRRPVGFGGDIAA